ncbi:hypothetical protein ACVYBP_18515 [Acinetobacter baumannii]|uniref:hypothetical protein n=1 Tax=Acinetobacter TaxID=469 RepID=UPI000405B03F|nr:MULTISPECIES: hypothetical protein [Acinetobacter]EKV9400263.1 hypothetical protein [Acinetobacter baumannii]EKW0189724.1 hypothetical protein [Acinetobacter baumannii]EKW6256269.1 hypothetical protein [Acinetobacter baumannii]EKW6893368.1 hypothetical protein [Acinetobacter baumannii]EKW8788282.1 hypothetical protein [Acinetobacter baumannii]
MDKCREEFEKQRYWIGLFRTGVDFDVILGEFGRYISNGTKSTDAMDLESFNEKWEAWANCWQHQQAKVEDLQKQLNEYMFVAETIDEMYVKEVQKSDELQKRVEWLEDRLKATDTLSKMRAAVIGSFNSQEFNARTRRKMMILKRAEQALKGDQYDEHRKKAEEAISEK